MLLEYQITDCLIKRYKYKSKGVNMSFKKLTGESLVKSIKKGKLHELKTNLDEEIVEKLTNRISEKKKEILKKIRKGKLGK